MNFKISKRVFYSALNTVSRAISSNSPLPALSGIKIEVNQDSIILTGSDSDISIQTTLSGNEEETNLIVKETGSIVIEAKYILEIVRKIDADEIELEIVDGSLTKISGMSAEFRINGMRALDYPAIDFTRPGQQFEMGRRRFVKSHQPDNLCDQRSGNPTCLNRREYEMQRQALGMRSDG